MFPSRKCDQFKHYRTVNKIVGLGADKSGPKYLAPDTYNDLEQGI